MRYRLKHQGLLVLFFVFVFLFSLSLGVQVQVNSCPSPWELERQQWLQREYGVSSFEELRAKFEHEALERVQASTSDLKQHLLGMQRLSVGTSTYSDIQTVLNRLEQPYVLDWSNPETSYEQPQAFAYTSFNFFTQMSVMSLSSMLLLGALFVPRLDRKLKGRHKLILFVLLISVWVFFAGYHVGYAVASSTEVTIEPLSFVSEASYIIGIDGTTIYARNGTTGAIDFSGTDASTVIQSAIDALTNGGRVLIKSGTYTITDTISVNGGISLWGEGIYKTILKLGENVNKNMIEWLPPSPGENFFFLGEMTLDGNRGYNTSGMGIYVDSVNGGTPRDFMIFRVWVKSFAEENIYANNVWGPRYVSVWVENSASTGIVSGGDHGLYMGLYVEANGQGAGFTGVDAHIEDHKGMGNIVVNNPGHDGIHIKNAEAIMDIVCRNSPYDGVEVLTKDCILRIITHDSYRGLRVTGSNNTIILRAFNNTIDLVDEGTGNRFYGPEVQNSGTATIANGTSSVTVDHGLADTPSIVVVTGHHSETVDCYVTNKTATQFTINVPANVTADRTVDWYAEV